MATKPKVGQIAQKQARWVDADPADFEWAGIADAPVAASAAAPVAAEKPSVARRIGDVGLSLGQGALGSFKSISDFLGADNPVSGGLDDASKFLVAQKSAQSQAATQASMARIKEAEASGSKLDEAQAYLGMLWDQPAEMIAQGVGSFATLGVGKVAQALKLAQAAKAAGVSKDVFLASGAAKQAVEEAAKFGFKTNIGLGAVQGVGAVKGSQFEQTYENARQQGMPEEEARALAAQAQEYGGAGTMQQVLGGVLGGVASATGPIERTLLGAGKKPVQSGVMSSVAKGFGKEFATEGGQGAQERFAGNDAAVDAGVLAPERRMQGVVGQGLMEGTIGGLLGGITGPLEGQAAALDPAVNPAKEAADAIRATEKLPESGALTKAVNAGVEAKAQAVESGGLELAPLVDGAAPETVTSNGLELVPRPGEQTPEPVDDPVRDQILALPDGARQDALRAYAVLNRNDVAKGVQQYNRKLLDRLLAKNEPSPEAAPQVGGIVRNFDPKSQPTNTLSLAPMGDATYDNGIDFQPNAQSELARRNAELDDLTQRAPRVSTAPVDLSLPTDPVQNYLDNLRSVNTPAARAYVRDFDAGRITPADVQQRMQAEQGLTPEQRIARAAAEAPAQVDTVAERLRSAAAEGMATPAPTDILNPSGEPFKTKMAADLAAKKTPGAAVLPVADGGFLVRPKESVNVQDVPQAPEVPQAAPDVSQPAQAQEAVGAQPAGPAAGVPTEGAGAVEAAGVARSKLLASLDQTGATREAVLDAQLKDAQDRLAQMTAATGVLPADKASRISEINQEIADLNSVSSEARQLDERDRRDGNTRSMLQGARQELDAAVRAGSVTPEAAQAIASNARNTGNAADASEAIFAAVDSSANGTASEPTQPQSIQAGQQAAQSVAAPAAGTGAVRLGRNNTPLSEGGKPFKTRKAAGDAKKLQPMMRVVTVPGGYALAEKTPAQLAAEDRASRRLRNPNTSARGEPIPAHAFIAAAGGLNRAAASDMGVDGNPRIGNRTLFAGQGRGLSMDQATQMLIQDGYLSEGATINDALALIKKSLTQPQYNADGIERIAQAEADAQFEDYLAAQEDAAAEDDEFDPFGPAPTALDEFSDDMLESSGYDSATDAIKAEVRALLEMANAQGIDAESIMLEAHDQTRNATEQDYYEAAKSALEAAIAGSNRDRSTPAGSEGQGAGEAAASAAEQGLNQPVALNQQAQAATENVAPAALELAAQTPAEAAARQEEAEQAEKSQAAAKRAADAAAKAEDDRKRIAQASVRAADRFELGQDPMDSLTGQGSVFDAQEPEQQAPAAAQPDTPKLTPAEAKSLMAWEDLGQKDGVKTHALTFYESQADKDAKRGRMIVAKVSKGDRSATAWMVDGEDKTFGALAQAKKLAEEVGMARAVADGFVAEDNPFAEYNALAKQYGYEVRPDGAIGSKGKFPGPTMKVKGGRLRIDSGSGDLLASYAGTSPDGLGKFLESFWYAEKKAGGATDAQGPRPMFSRAPATEVRNLVTLHNLTDENLRFADSMGGIPVPSIGITKLDSPFSGFGGITLIAPKGMVDPESGVPVFDRDAWTARFPEMNFKKPKRAKADAFYERMKAMTNGLGVDEGNFLSNLWESMVNASVTNPDKVADHLRRYDAARMAYARDVLGKNIKVPMRSVPLSSPAANDKQLQAYWKKNGQRLIELEYELSGSNFSNTPEYKSFVREVEGAVRRYAEASGKPERADAYVSMFLPDGEFGPGGFDRLGRDFAAVGKKEVDGLKLREAVRKVVPDNDPAYLQWVSDQVKPLFDAPTITLRGKEVEPTLDNIVDAMTVGATAGVEKSMTFGPGKLAAHLGKRFKSMAEIKAARDQVVSESAETEAKKATDAILDEYRTHLAQFFTFKDWRGNIDTWAANDSSMEALARAGKQALTDANIRAALSRKDFKGVDQRGIDLARQAIEALRSTATNYFEAKPQRAVRLNEFKGAVVPKGIPPESVAILEKNGITVEFYGKAEGAREKAIEKLAKRLDRQSGDVLFARSETPPADSNARNAATQLLVDGLKAKWTRAPEIIVARNMQDAQIPQEVRDYDALLKSQGATGEPRGFIYKGKVYLLTDQLKGPQQIAEVLFHEVLGHYGLRGAFGDSINSILQQMGTMRRKDVVAKAREYGLFNKDALGGLDKAAASDSQIWAAMSDKQRLDAAEEVLAEMAQTKPELGYVKRAIAAIRNWLRANVPGFKNLKLTDADIVQAYILPARAYVTRSNETAQQAIDRAMTDAGFIRTDDRINFSRTTAQSIASSMGDMTPDQEKAYKNVAGVKAVPTVRERMDALKANLGLKLRQGLVDQFAAIKQLDQNAYVQARMSKGTDGTLEAMLMYGKPFMRDGAPDVDVKDGGFAKVLASLKGEQDRWMMWIAAQRAEKLKAEGKENLMTDDDISALKTLNAGKMADGTARSQVYAKALQELNAYNDAMLKLAMDSGLIDQAAYDLMAGQPYVPFYRIMEDGDMKGPKFSSGLTNQKAWQKLKGGTQQLNADLLQNMLLNWSHLLQASAKNRAATATMDAAEKMAVAYKVDADTKGSVKVMRDGSAEHWMVEDPYLLDAISAIHYVPSPLMKPLAKFKQLLTWGVTVNPTFKIRNLIRDSVSAIAQSELGYNPGANVAKGWKLTAKDSQIYASMLASGGLIKFGTQENTDRLRAQVAKLGGVVLDKSGTERFFGQIKDLYDVYNEFGDRAENVNRAALYDALIKKGKTHAEAAFMARDLMDFSMSGSAPVVRFLTQAVPFLNARLVGLDKLGRAAMEDPRRFAAVTGAVALASLALLAAYSDDDDWKKREDWDRDAYWWFKVGDQAYRIPKPFEVGAIGTLAERTAELMMSEEMTGKRYLERVNHMLSSTFSFNPIPQAFKPLLDLYANKDSFTGRAIESQADQRLRPQDRYNERTSEVAKFLGGLGLPDPAQLVKGEYSALSPKQVEHLIRGYFSWVGTAAMTVSDFGLRPLADRGERPDMRLKDVFIAGNFVENLPTGSSRYVTQMYEQSRQVEQAYASYQEAIKAGDTEKAQSIKESAGPLLRNRPAYTAATRQLAEINRAAKRIEADQAMAGAAKRARLTQLEQQRQVIAQRVSRLAAATP